MKQPVFDKNFSFIKGINYRISHSDHYCDINSEIFDPSHIHHCFEIYLNISGYVSFLHNNDVYKISPADIIVSAPGDIHHCIYNSSCRHNHYCLWFEEFSDSEFIKETFKKQSIGGFHRLTENAGTKLISLFFRLENSGHKQDSAIIFMQILSILCDEDNFIKDCAKTEESRISKILEYIDENLSSISSSRDIADAFYISCSTLNRIFKTDLNLTVHQIIEAKRLSCAENLLRLGNSVTDAGYLSGFSDCSHFISLFKKKFGITPHKYKSIFNPHI